MVVHVISQSFEEKKWSPNCQDLRRLVLVERSFVFVVYPGFFGPVLWGSKLQVERRWTYLLCDVSFGCTHPQFVTSFQCCESTLKICFFSLLVRYPDSRLKGSGLENGEHAMYKCMFCFLYLRCFCLTSQLNRMDRSKFGFMEVRFIYVNVNYFRQFVRSPSTVQRRWLPVFLQFKLSILVKIMVLHFSL